MGLCCVILSVLCIVQGAKAAPLLTTSGPALEELIENKSTLESLLEHQKQDGHDDLEDIFTTIIEANKGSQELLQNSDIAINEKRSTINIAKRLWPKSASGNVDVPYILSSGFGQQNKALIKAALQEFMTLTCVRFVERTLEKDYVSITSEKGCWSSIGKRGGTQVLSLAKYGCMSFGVIQHEVLHSLGFVHEHNRSDRDNYVDIVFKYISKGNTGNFMKINTNNLGLQYDYSSVMHYGRFSYSNTTGQATVLPKPDPSVQVGQRYGLSSLDVSKVKRLYDCNLCSTLLSGTSGTVSSGNYPSAYPNNADCVWLIRVQSGQILLQFQAFDVHYSSNCVSDYLRVYDGSSKSSPVLLERACGTGQLPTLVSSRNVMLIEFVSDGEEASVTGFMASYTTVSCGGSFNKNNGIITSPGYPNRYPNTVDCENIILAPAGYKIILTFKTFQLESKFACNMDNDHVTVYDGSRSTSPMLGKFCGASQIPSPVTSTGNTLLLEFHSDKWINNKGFQATYSFV